MRRGRDDSASRQRRPQKRQRQVDGDGRLGSASAKAPRHTTTLGHEGSVWRPRGDSTIKLEPLDPSLCESNPAEFFRRFLAPAKPADFMVNAWAKKAVDIPIATRARTASTERLTPLVENFLRDLDLVALLEESPSERIHAWLKHSGHVRERPLDSVPVDADAALGLHRAGASLYFRAPEELERLLVSGFTSALGAGLCGRYPGDGRPRGEIETFVCSSGHVTGWHTDFQHNFTIQLRGTKRWRFKHGPVKHNLRALTPHYRTRSNFEEQMKMHLLSSPSSTDYRPPDTFFEDAEEVILREGSVLYHPAGIWHHVECLSDMSVSINVSLFIASWADIITNAFSQLLWQSPSLRAPALVGCPLEGESDVDARLSEAQRLASRLSTSELLPRAAHAEALTVSATGPLSLKPGVKRSQALAAAGIRLKQRVEQLPKHVNLVTTNLGIDIQNVTPKTCLRLSSLVVAVRLAPRRCKIKSVARESASENGSASESGDEVGADVNAAVQQQRFALHYNFGNEDLASWFRVVLLCPPTSGGSGGAKLCPLAAAMEWLCQRRIEAQRRAANKPVGGEAFGETIGDTFEVSALLEAKNSPKHKRTSNRPNSAKNRKWLLRLVRVLVHFGLLLPVEEASVAPSASVRKKPAAA
eukprot:TRINITY_DN69208_c0_g1_i1.p1 TRINITY_DN69208_c0_g1~~TRINITY_DN69208_c0_g1_i1.p1  ORF type:complete len:643 (-),score=86.12 TRINITY_DN69208_c0_g1_i1:50-1978(-)